MATIVYRVVTATKIKLAVLVSSKTLSSNAERVIYGLLNRRRT